MLNLHDVFIEFDWSGDENDSSYDDLTIIMCAMRRNFRSIGELGVREIVFINTSTVRQLFTLIRR